MPKWDVIVIGAGHNALICAAYLQKSGLKTLVLERRLEVGGGVSTEEVTLPGFHHNLHSAFHRYVPELPWYKDLELQKYGVRYIWPPVQNVMPLSDGRCLVIHQDPKRSAKNIARVSERDAKTYLTLFPHWRRMGEQYILPEMYSPPIPLEEKTALWERTALGRELLAFSRKSCMELTKEVFENSHVRALVLYYVAVKGWDLYDPGLGFQVPMATVGATQASLCVGGSHQLAHALYQSIISNGGHILSGQRVEEIWVDGKDGGRAVGVRLDSGESLRAGRAVVSALNPHQTFFQLLDRKDLLGKVQAQARKFEYGLWTLFGGHLALNEPPRYLSAKFDPDVQKGINVNIGYEVPEDFDAHWREAGAGLPPKKPGMQCGVFTLFDPTQAPRGKHTALLWQFAPFDLGEGGPEGWDQIKEAYLERCIARWRHYAPNLDNQNILGRYAYTPLDIARKVHNMAKGDFHSGAIIRRQLLERRPLPGLSGYRTPIERLYLTGSSTHPGGLITGAPGYNAAGVIAKDLRVRRWWDPPDVRRLWSA